MTQFVPDKVQLHKKSKRLEVGYGDESFLLEAEYLRVYSPSAEVKGHGPGQETLQSGKQDVGITHLEATGNYAVRIIFDDGHDSGIFTWDYLYDLGKNHTKHWNDYLARLKQAGKNRDVNVSIVKLIDPS